MMKHKIIVLIIVICLCGFGEIIYAQTNVDGEIVQILKKYDEAWNRKDAVQVGKILADEYIYFSSTGGTTSRRATLDFLSSPKYIIKSAARSEIKTYRTSNTVVVSSRWKGNLIYNDEEINDDQRCSLVFAKHGKNWRLLSEHCTQIITK